MNKQRTQAATWLAGTAIVAGVAGGLVAGQVAFAASTGASVFRLFTISRLGALVLVGLGVLALIGARRASRAMVTTAGALFVVVAISQMAGIIQPWNRLGGHASTAALCIGLGAGLLALARTPEPPPEG
jgi:hypothetical protein